MSKKRKDAAAILAILVVCNWCCILGNSLAGPAGSPEAPAEALPGFLQELLPDPAQRAHWAQALASSGAFACLGGLSAGLLIAFRKVKLHPVFHLWAAGLVWAACTETMQSSPQLPHMWVEFAGFSAGLLAVLCIRALVFRSQPKETPAKPSNVIVFPGNSGPSKGPKPAEKP